jgi:hypothetical protein
LFYSLPSGWTAGIFVASPLQKISRLDSLEPAHGGVPSLYYMVCVQWYFGQLE